MNKSAKGIVLAGVVTVMSLTSGCMGLSLFSSTHTHTHYESKPEIEQRVTELEKKVQTMEPQTSTNQVFHTL
jgi:hypothetical protein